MLYRYYIGANNKTKKVETKKAVGIISKKFEGFTVSKSLGYWQGKAEKSIIVEIETNNKKQIMATALELCKALKQQAVGLATVGKMGFVSF
jgi:tRNA(Glu) U13 pseudouridine synthase TruD